MNRRDLLKTTASTVTAGSLLGAAASTATATSGIEDVWNPAHESNYTDANRTASDVRWIVVHTIEGSYEAGYSWFENPDSNVSSHFVVGNEPDQIMQMVEVEDIAWTNGGDGTYNDTGINIEMEGSAESTDFNSNMYGQVAEIIDWACATYNIPRHHPTGMAPCNTWNGNGGVIAHSQIPAADDCSSPTSGKYDPGYTWDWFHVMDLAGGTVGAKFTHDEWVQTTADLNTRYEPGLENDVAMTVPNGAWGQIVDGPVDKNGYTWWRVYWSDYDTYGWSVEAYME